MLELPDIRVRKSWDVQELTTIVEDEGGRCIVTGGAVAVVAILCADRACYLAKSCRSDEWLRLPHHF